MHPSILPPVSTTLINILESLIYILLVCVSSDDIAIENSRLMYDLFIELQVAYVVVERGRICYVGNSCGYCVADTPWCL